MCDDGECADPSIDIPIAETIVHEKYVGDSRAQNDDIALIRLAQPVKFTDYIQPICLPSVAENLLTKNYDGAALKVASFGNVQLQNGWSVNGLIINYFFIFFSRKFVLNNLISILY